MNPRETKIFRDLLESIGVSFKSKGTRVDHNPLYDAPQKPKEYISNDLTGRSTAYDREGNLVPLQQGLISTEVFPRPSAMLAGTTADAVAMKNPLLGLAVGAGMSTPTWKGTPDDVVDAYNAYKLKYNDYTPQNVKSYELPEYTSPYSKYPGADKNPVTHNNEGAVKAFVNKVKEDNNPSKRAKEDSQMRAISLREQGDNLIRHMENKLGYPLEGYERMNKLVMGKDGKADIMWMPDYLNKLEFKNQPYYDGTDDFPLRFNDIPIKGKLVQDASTGFPMQYAQQLASMIDIDHPDIGGLLGLHHNRGQITKKGGANTGETWEMAQEYIKNNPDSYLIGGMTGGGNRLFDISNRTALAMTEPNNIQWRVNHLNDLGSDPAYAHFETLKNQDRLRRGDTEGISSDMRLDEKPMRITGYSDPNFTGGPPMGYQEMFQLGDPNNANAILWERYKWHNALFNQFRKADNLVNPNKPDMGLGALDSKYFDPMYQSLAPNMQEILRRNWKLGLTGGLLPSLTEDD